MKTSNDITEWLICHDKISVSDMERHLDLPKGTIRTDGSRSIPKKYLSRIIEYIENLSQGENVTAKVVTKNTENDKKFVTDTGNADEGSVKNVTDKKGTIENPIIAGDIILSSVDGKKIWGKNFIPYYSDNKLRFRNRYDGLWRRVDSVVETSSSQKREKMMTISPDDKFYYIDKYGIFYNSLYGNRIYKRFNGKKPIIKRTKSKVDLNKIKVA